MKLRPMAMQLTRKEINSGANTSFWYDNWSNLGPLIEFIGERGSMDLGIPKNATVEHAIQIYRTRGHRVYSLRMIGQEILTLKSRGLNQFDDECLWMRENGEFKPGFLTAQTWNITRRKDPKVAWFKGVWFAEGTPKFSFIVWLAVQNRLATGDRILRWNAQAISTCWLCQSEIETRDHLFFDCAYSKEVWKGTVKNMAGLGDIHQWSRVLQAVTNGCQGKELTFLMRYSFQMVVYAIWHERNIRRVGEPSQHAVCLISRLDKMMRNKITSLRKKVGRKHDKTMQIWFGRSV